MRNFLARLFRRDATQAARTLAHIRHKRDRAAIRARCDQMRHDMGLKPIDWGKL